MATTHILARSWIASNDLSHLLHTCLLTACASPHQDESPDVRQSAFAIVGDLARACPGSLTPILTQLVALSLANLEGAAISQTTMSACNNACWALGALLSVVCCSSLYATLGRPRPLATLQPRAELAAALS